MERKDKIMEKTMKRFGFIKEFEANKASKKHFSRVDLSARETFFTYFWNGEIPEEVYTKVEGDITYISFGFGEDDPQWGTCKYASHWGIKRVGNLYIIAYLGNIYGYTTGVQKGYEHLWCIEKGGKLISEVKGEKLRDRLPDRRCFR